MKSSGKLTDTETRSGRSGELTKDPFAVDFFGVSSAPSGELPDDPRKESDSHKQNKKHKKSEWHLHLPQIDRSEAEFSAALQRLPDSLTEISAEKIGELIARYTFRQKDEVECSIISVAETNLSESVKKLAKSPQVFFTVECQPDNSSALFAVNTDFASAIIDLILGGQGEEFSDPRELSPIENAIVEFLIVNILSEINEFLGEPLLCLQSVGNLPEKFLAEQNTRGAEFVFVVETGDSSGILTAFAPPDFLSGLDRAQNPLLFNSRSNQRKIEDLEKLAPKINVQMHVGTTFLDADSILFLEPDDIVLIEKSEISLEKGLIGDNLQISVGRGRNFRLKGKAETREFGGEMFFEIKEISNEKSNRRFTPIKLEMDEKEIELNDESQQTPETEMQEMPDETSVEEEQISTASLENVQVALRVEIAADKISLRELQNMRAGQIIALGCRPTDPVKLVVDQREEPVATGELVEIEGQLGVRLTKVFI